ncbi:hypothetical protein CBR_g6366 [Chara braunii]|uniref:Uncharacterized protein n=1 Tax=Chara braunii TaxID=69332 RepID=A0A388KJM5_CHABU|nr:hypothetical protein CBR_g6366 [Chara braunii]|eukprot:GBG70237.1 hypothetical protein CBR_g6366 [Chara braunii]
MRRFEVLEETVATIKTCHDAESAKERIQKEEEDKRMKEKEEEDRKTQQIKDREELQKMIGETIDTRLGGTGVNGVPAKQNGASELDKLCAEVAELKRVNTSSAGTRMSEIEKLRAEIAELKRAQAPSGPAGHVAEATGQVQVEREEAWKSIHESYEKRMTILEEQIVTLRRLKAGAVSEAEAWKLEAQRPENKRGGINIGVTPMTQVRVRSRITPIQTSAPRKKMLVEDYQAFAQQNEEEVNLLWDMRSKEVERRKEAEQEAEQLKEKLDRLEIEKVDKTKSTATCLRVRLEAVIDDTTGPSSRGKKKATTTDDATKIDKLKNDKEAFVKSNRLDLRSMKKDAVQAICEKDGVQYTTLDKTKEEIVKKRVARAFSTSTNETTRQNGVVIEEISDDNTEVSANLGKTVDGEEDVS